MKLIDTIVPDRVDRVPFLIFVLFVAVLAIAGGGSRADILGQAVVRGAAIVAMVAVVLTGRNLRIFDYRMVALLLAAMALLIAAQLVPLPPAVWTVLPGRSLFVTVMPAAGLPQPWRPINIVPDAGINSLFSLLPPIAMLLIIASLTGRGCERLLIPTLIWIVASALFALVQAAGMAPDNFLINAVGDNSGFFANRNHQALFLAIGMALSIFFGFERGAHWRNRQMWLAIAITTFLFISILITGSRSGTLVGVIALLVGLPLAQGSMAPGWRKRILIMLIVAIALIGLATYSSIYAGRAFSLDRVTAVPVEDEFRFRALPTVWSMVQSYFPAGAGFGTFDAAFRTAEPFALLETTYFNHAHNDLLEVLFEGGLGALIILVAAMIAFGRATVAVFVARTSDRNRTRQGRLGALIILIVVFASASDYPARTPLIMSVLVIAGCWLCRGARPREYADAVGHDTLPLQSDLL